jgi:succinate dehydrogenase/fumarate reductase flavoprotein subunit
MTDVLVIGTGPAGVLAALRAADLGAQTALVASPSRQQTNLASRSAGKHTRRHKQFGEC